MRIPKKHTPYVTGKLTFSYTCPDTKKEVIKELSYYDFETSGGCRGHHGEDSYCYCGDVEVTLKVSCPECGQSHSMPHS